MANSKLQMPANYMALNESEMSCVEGGGIISQVCYAFGRMFRSTYYDKWESESKTLEQSHGAVVSKKNGVYPMQPRKHRSKVTQDTFMSSIHCPNRNGSLAQSHGSRQRNAASGKEVI